jgi:hypothetical protein
MQTIGTKILPATNFKPTRVKSTSSSGISKTIPFDYGMSTEENYMKVARKLKESLRWEGKMIGGHTKNGMVFVFQNDRYVI